VAANVGEVLHQPPGDRQAEDRLAAADRADGSQHLGRAGPFVQIAARTGPHGCKD
jgi:hypothetical protein